MINYPCRIVFEPRTRLSSPSGCEAPGRLAKQLRQAHWRCRATSRVSKDARLFLLILRHFSLGSANALCFVLRAVQDAALPCERCEQSHCGFFLRAMGVRVGSAGRAAPLLCSPTKCFQLFSNRLVQHFSLTRVTRVLKQRSFPKSQPLMTKKTFPPSRAWHYLPRSASIPKRLGPIPLAEGSEITTIKGSGCLDGHRLWPGTTEAPARRHRGCREPIGVTIGQPVTAPSPGFSPKA